MCDVAMPQAVEKPGTGAAPMQQLQLPPVIDKEGLDDPTTRAVRCLQSLSLECQIELGEIISSSPSHAKRRSWQPAAEAPFRVVLHHAVITGNLAAVRSALGGGASIKERDDLRHSVLHFAVANRDVRMVRELLSQGANVNVANKAGWSPLHYSVLGCDPDIVQALLEHGAYPSYRDNCLITPLHLACTRSGAWAALRRVIELLVSHGGDSALSATDELGQTPLHVAASCGGVGATCLLLALGADPFARDGKGRAPGHAFQRTVPTDARRQVAEALRAAAQLTDAARQLETEGLPPAEQVSRLLESLQRQSKVPAWAREGSLGGGGGGGAMAWMAPAGRA